MFSSKENGQCFALEHLPAQLTQVERDKNEQGRGNDSFVNNNNNNALEYCDVLIGPCARVVTRTSRTLPKYNGVLET
jgi:hypothetical protein